MKCICTAKTASYPAVSSCLLGNSLAVLPSIKMSDASLKALKYW